MTDRERLIWLMCEAKKADTEDAPFFEFLADFLIAYGVTFAKDNNVPSKWIPVTERLPEKQVDVVARSNKNGEYMFIGYRGYISGAWMENGVMHIGDVTHWMPLPEPPGEGEK